MSQSDRTLLTIPGSDVLFDEVDLPLRARRREAIGRLALLAADAIAVAGSLLLVAVLTDARFTPWVAALVPLYALVAKMAGLYDRDQFVLLKTTLDEAPTLVAVAAIFALVIEGGRALEFTGRSHPFLLWGMLTVVLIAARAAARFVVVRTTAPERILVIGDAATTAMLERKLAADPGLNAEVVGRVSVELGPREEDENAARNRRGPAGCAQRAPSRSARSWPRRARARTSPTSSAWRRCAGSGSRCSRACSR